MTRALKFLAEFAGYTAGTARFPPSVASRPAFTVKLDTERLDIGLAAAMGKFRRMGG